MGWLTGGGFSLHSLSGAHEPRSGTLFPGGEYCRRRTKEETNGFLLFVNLPLCPRGGRRNVLARKLQTAHAVRAPRKAGAGNLRHRVNYELLIPNS